jgi:hypothetical protein
MNNRCFENHKMVLEELKSLFFNIFYFLDSRLSFIFSFLFFLPIISRWLLLYIPCVLETLHVFNDILFIY